MELMPTIYPKYRMSLVRVVTSRKNCLLFYNHTPQLVLGMPGFTSLFFSQSKELFFHSFMVHPQKIEFCSKTLIRCSLTTSQPRWVPEQTEHLNRVQPASRLTSLLVLHYRVLPTILKGDYKKRHSLKCPFKYWD